MLADIMSICLPLRLIAACCFCLSASCSSARWTDEAAAGFDFEDDAAFADVEARRRAMMTEEVAVECRTGDSSDMTTMVKPVR